MGLDTAPFPVTAGVQAIDSSSIADVGSHLSALAGRIRQAARRSRMFSWYSWGFIFSAYLGIFLYSILGSLYQVTVTTVTDGGVSTTTTYPWWDPFVAVLPGVVVLALAIREVVLGRRDVRLGTVALDSHRHPNPPESSPGWTETIQQCQRMVTHSRSEVEWSFVPLVLGWFGLVETFVFAVQSVFWPGAFFPSLVIIAPLVGFASLAFLWPLYLYARRWIAGFQGLLDRQVGELSRLEAEFLWRFAGASAVG